MTRPSSDFPCGDRPTALVTGGAKRVGRAVALKLAQAGYDVAITYHTSSAEARKVVKAIERLGCKAGAIEADLSRDDAHEAIYAAFGRQFCRLDALVNNASIYEGSPLGEITCEAFDRHMAVNVRAPLMLIQKFAAHLGAGAPQRLGRVVNFIDTHVMGQPMCGYAAYNASKAALLQITQTMALELAPAVTVNGIAPGVVAWAQSYSQAQRRRYLQRVPLARAGTADDAAAAVLFLVRDAGYTTGEIIRVDGGRGLT